ncbi:signal peptidase I [Knoellia sp. p5-6-4]|uniref:signal peptidase I n=1 Tax=unclassified Knoellia TaxID=2618719 RepID=UPI0023DA495B|nr:signal peptidase I [Knoellia sp. p5-6-4]MDF2143981.1 signal peptidase I [Knoellia sp. p5-6-4]
MNSGPDSPQSTPAAAPAPADAAAASSAPPRRPSWLLLAGIALLVMMLVRAFLVQSFYVPSASMEPAITPGDRILVDKTAGADDLRRGDVVVFDGTRSFAVADRSPQQADGLVGRVLGGAASLFGVDLAEQDYVKRIVGLPGDRVLCCDAQGRLTVNGRAVEEDYLPEGTKPSETTFDVTVPAGRLWLMGDNRSNSADSRAHLGDPGGGMVRTDDVVGRATAIYWPLDRLGGLATSPALRSIPAAEGAR